MDLSNIPSGVITGDALVALFKAAKEQGFAIPAVNCSSSSTCNAVMEAGAKAKSPVIIQVSQGGGQFVGGKGLDDLGVDKMAASVAGSVAIAYHVRSVAKFYGIPVVLHSDHCAKKLLPWFDGMLDANKDFFEKTGEPLFSSHMLDLSEEPDEENIELCVKYFKKMVPMKLFLEMEIGITGGEEDGVNNEDIDPEKLYTTPEQVYAVYQALAPIGEAFSIAAAFGNVHGVYKPGNVKLSPEKLGKHQAYTKAQLGCTSDKPIFLVMHGGSGSTDNEIQEAVSNGVVKMNIDTDTQWAYWDGLRAFEAKSRDYLQGQIGNPEGSDKPNKKYYDPRKWVREAEKAMVKRVGVSLEKLNAVGKLGDAYKAPKPEIASHQCADFKKSSPMGDINPISIAIGAIIGFALAKAM